MHLVGILFPHVDIIILIFIYLFQLGFHPKAVVGRRTKIGKRKNKRGNNTQNNKKTQNTQNRRKNTKQETEIKRMLKKHKSSNYKITNIGN